MSLGAYPTSEALPNITLATPLADKTFLDVANYFQPQINGGFVLISAYLVFFMHAGFCMVRYCGAVYSHGAVHNNSWTNSC